MATEKQGSLGSYYAGGSLTTKQQEVNALYICKYLTTIAEPQWTLNAVAGLCGNIESECHFDPGLEEAGPGSGFGLIQWTPGTIHSNWCADNGYSDTASIDSQLAHIADEAKKGVSWNQENDWGSINYEAKIPKYQNFATSVLDPYFLACAYAWCRERSGVVQWGFHTKNHGNNGVYCMPGYSKPNKGCYACYKNKYGEQAADKRAELNRQELRDERGGAANKWYNYFVKALFIPYLDDSDTTIYKLPYYVSSRNNRGGLNYNTAIEDWPKAQSGWSATDKAAIVGTGTVLPNCTSWAWGRAYEIMGKAPKRFSGDAGNWWNYYDEHEEDFKNAGYIKSTTTPALGAIVCWQDPKNRSDMGHVAIVEAIHEDGTISISESGYTTWSWRPSYFNVQKKVNPSKIHTKYEFVGYIQLPTIRSLAPSIEYFKSKTVGTETATFEISVKANGNSLDNVYYELSTGASKSISVKDGINTLTISNLVPNTQYSIKVIIETGTSFIESSSVLFNTKQDYPDPVKNIIINTKVPHEASSFSVVVTEPVAENWGYWRRIGRPYGYRTYIVDNGRLVTYEDMAKPKTSFSIVPGIPHEHNFQIGISTWVTDNDGNKIFALEDHSDFPVCSNSICLKNISEMSDNCYLLIKENTLLGQIPKINRLQPYYIKGSDSKPLKVFKVDDF